jgi:hypothetical protein
MADAVDDPILALIDERLAVIEAAMPVDLTKIAPGSAPLGLERLVLQALEGDSTRPVDRELPRIGTRRIRLSALVKEGSNAAHR